MRELLQEQRALGFPAFVGTDATIRIPLRESVVNTVLGQVISGRGMVKGLTLQILENNRIGFDLSIDKSPLPKQIRGDLVPARVTNFDSDPRLLILFNIPGAIGFLVKLVPKNLIAERLPDFVTISDNRIFVDFKAFLVKRNLADLAPIIRSLRITSQRGILFLEIHLHITEERAS